MRSLKTSGGLTRGPGMTEQQRAIWLLSMSVCAEVNRAMQEMTSVKYDTSEQNKYMMTARQQRDLKDTRYLMVDLNDRSPFHDSPLLRNIMTGIHAGEGNNVDDANAIGEQGMTEMTSKNGVCYTFKRRQQTATFASKSLIKIGDVQLQVDPQLPFKRIIIASASLDHDKEEAITYKLSSCPSTCLVRELQKLVS